MKRSSDIMDAEIASIRLRRFECASGVKKAETFACIGSALNGTKGRRIGMTLIDLDSKDVQNYTNKDGLIAISDLRMLALADDYVEVDQVLEIIDSRYSEFIGLVKEGVQPTPDMLQNSIRLDVLALKGEANEQTTEKSDRTDQKLL